MKLFITVFVLLVTTDAAFSGDTPKFTREQQQAIERVLHDLNRPWDRKEFTFNKKQIVYYVIKSREGHTIKIFGDGILFTCTSTGFKTADSKELPAERLNAWNAHRAGYCTAYSLLGDTVLSSGMDIPTAKEERRIAAWLGRFEVLVAEFDKFGRQANP